MHLHERSKKITYARSTQVAIKSTSLKQPIMSGMINHILKTARYRKIVVISSLVVFIFLFGSMFFIVSKASETGGMPILWSLENIWYNSTLQVLSLPIISVLFGVLIAMQIYIKRELSDKSAKELGMATGGAASGFMSAIGAIGGCPVCLLFLTSLIGTGLTAFLQTYSLAISLFSIILLSTSIYFARQKIVGKCANCK